MSQDLPNPPRATYRIQLQTGFDFGHAGEIFSYLAELGVSHLYTSPCLQAAPGSTSGYDVVDYCCVSAEIGGEEAMARFAGSLLTNKLGHILDIVPNHMGIEGGNNWWLDVLQNGPSSLYAHCFDVHWQTPQQGLRNKVLLPVLGDHYSRLIELGKIRLEQRDGRLMVRYEASLFPLSPESLRELLDICVQRCEHRQLRFIAEVLSFLPAAMTPDKRLRRHQVQLEIDQMMRALCEESPLVVQTIQQVVAEMNRNPDALDKLLEMQNYRLAYWRSADNELNYRRFFNINNLIGMRTEDPQVFNLTHELVLRWLRRRRVQGLRVDHVDGLREPLAYLRRLREQAGPAWIVVEKILEPSEALPSWPVAGTTGYDFLNQVNGLFVDQAGEAPMTQLYHEITDQPTDFKFIVHESKKKIIDAFGGDVSRLTGLLLALCRNRRQFRDYTAKEIRQVVTEVIISYPVYRTYVCAEGENERPGSGDGDERTVAHHASETDAPRGAHAHDSRVSPEDERYVRMAVEGGKLMRPDLDPALFDFVQDILLLRTLPLAGSPALHSADPGRRNQQAEFVMRLQQLTGAVMAKGVEDTAFYRFNRLVSLNEVGGDPAVFGISVEEFHRLMAESQRYWPATMRATSTHDTKRSEDVRARINLLSEIPFEWADALRRWMRLNEPFRMNGLPDRNMEYLFYQTLVGAWPLPLVRALEYMHKASHEAKLNTCWAEPNAEYDAALRAFVESALGNEEFLRDLQAFVGALILPGRINSLAQTLIKLAAPGVPDIYQGTELWDLSLVDPDNRRPVDYTLRMELLARLRGMRVENVLTRMEEGLPKLWLIRQTLGLRRRRPDLFGPHGHYRPLQAQGDRAQHVVAFARGESIAAVAPRLVMRLLGPAPTPAEPSATNPDHDLMTRAASELNVTQVELPKGRWDNILTGEPVESAGSVNAGRLLARFPVALLERTP